MTTYRLMDGAAGRPGTGSTGTQPPASPTGYSGSYIAGLVFSVSPAATAWFDGYWWWVPAGGDTGPAKCALWHQNSPANYTQGLLVAGSVVTSGTLTAGQWNYIPLPSPMLLSNAGTTYVAAVGFSTAVGFPDTQHQFGAGDPYASGIASGPLRAPASSGTGSGPQSPFSTASADPSAVMPAGNDLDDLLWLDVQVTDTPPAGASYRLWPNRPYAIGDSANNGVSTDTGGYTIGPQFSLSQACTLSRLWFYSNPGVFGGAAAAAVPARCGIWDMSTQQVVPGTDNAPVPWKKPDGTAGGAAAGWVYCDYSAAGVTLAANHGYKATVWYAGGSTWRTVVDTYWASPGDGQNGITQGPLTAPDNANATPGQESWSGPNLAWAYPGSTSFPENDWVDVEVTPLAAVFTGAGTLSGKKPSAAGNGTAGGTPPAFTVGVLTASVSTGGSSTVTSAPANTSTSAP